MKTSKTSKLCAFVYDAEHPDVESGRVKAGESCDQPRYKNHRDCIKHCEEDGLLSKNELSKIKAKRGGEVEKELGKELEDIVGGGLDFLFATKNYSAKIAYKYVKLFNVGKVGEGPIEMYIYACWRFADEDTRIPHSTSELAEILGVKESVFAEWDNVPELFVMMSERHIQLGILIGKPLIINWLIKGMREGKDKAYEIYAKKFLKIDVEEEVNEDSIIGMSKEKDEQAAQILKHLNKDGGLDKKLDNASEAVKHTAVLSGLTRVN